MLFLQEIDWNDWKEKIHTDGVVDKLKAKYEKFMQQEYSVEAGVQKIGNQTEQMKKMEIASTYNFFLHLTHFGSHLQHLEVIRNVGDVTQMSVLETIERTRDEDALKNAQFEMGNIASPFRVEHGVYSRIVTQFSWGSRSLPPFVHSSDALNGVVATLGKLGK